MARTPTSATSAERGFTLIELLVTLVILGLASAAVVLAMPDSRGELRDESERLAARLVAARDAAIVSGRDMSVRFDAAGYTFEVRRSGTWTPVEARALAPRRWPEGLVVVTDPARISFDVTGLASPATVRLSHGGANARITVEAAGAVRIDAG